MDYQLVAATGIGICVVLWSIERIVRRPRPDKSQSLDAIFEEVPDFGACTPTPEPDVIRPQEEQTQEIAEIPTVEVRIVVDETKGRG